MIIVTESRITTDGQYPAYVDFGGPIGPMLHAWNVNAQSHVEVVLERNAPSDALLSTLGSEGREVVERGLAATACLLAEEALRRERAEAAKAEERALKLHRSARHAAQVPDVRGTGYVVQEFSTLAEAMRAAAQYREHPVLRNGPTPVVWPAYAESGFRIP